MELKRFFVSRIPPKEKLPESHWVSSFFYYCASRDWHKEICRAQSVNQQKHLQQPSLKYYKMATTRTGQLTTIGTTRSLDLANHEINPSEKNFLTFFWYDCYDSLSRQFHNHSDVKINCRRIFSCNIRNVEHYCH